MKEQRPPAKNPNASPLQAERAKLRLPYFRLSLATGLLLVEFLLFPSSQPSAPIGHLAHILGVLAGWLLAIVPIALFYSAKSKRSTIVSFSNVFLLATLFEAAIGATREAMVPYAVREREWPQDPNELHSISYYMHGPGAFRTGHPSFFDEQGALRPYIIGYLPFGGSLLLRTLGHPNAIYNPTPSRNERTLASPSKAPSRTNDPAPSVTAGAEALLTAYENHDVDTILRMVPLRFFDSTTTPSSLRETISDAFDSCIEVRKHIIGKPSAGIRAAGTEMRIIPYTAWIAFSPDNDVDDFGVMYNYLIAIKQDGRDSTWKYVEGSSATEERLRSLLDDPSSFQPPTGRIRIGTPDSPGFIESHDIDGFWKLTDRTRARLLEALSKTRKDV